MEPELPNAYNRQATITDLLDRVLDKGLYLRADLVISVAGIPLIGVTLSAAVAGIETLREYGIVSDWDEAIRTLPPDQRQAARPTDWPTGLRPGKKKVAIAVPA